jgi:hypothetical protein
MINLVSAVSSDCDPGYFKAGDVCMLMVPLSHNYSGGVDWMLGPKTCDQHGAVMAVIKSPSEVRDVFHKHDNNDTFFIVGLRRSPAPLPLW